MNKTVRIGTQKGLGNLYCKIKYIDKKLSITGVEGPKSNGDALGSCGQIDMHEWQILEYAPGWDAETAKQFREYWKEWHLNDMNAGSPNQEEYLKANPVEYVYPQSHYEVAKKALEEAGLQPDPSYDNYSYGSKWLFREVPQEVIDFLEALPDTDKTPAWV